MKKQNSKLISILILMLIISSVSFGQSTDSTSMDIVTEFMSRKQKIMEAKLENLGVDQEAGNLFFYFNNQEVEFYWKGVEGKCSGVMNTAEYKQQEGKKRPVHLEIDPNYAFVVIYSVLINDKRTELCFIVYSNGSGGYYKTNDHGNIMINTGKTNFQRRASIMNQVEIIIFERGLENFFQIIDQNALKK